MTDKSCAVLTKLLPQIARFMDMKGLSGAAFGNLAVGDGRLVLDLMQGQPISESRQKQITDYIARNEHTIYGQAVRGVSVREPASAPAPSIPEDGDKAFLKALWKNHTPILERLAQQGLQVVRV